MPPNDGGEAVAVVLVGGPQQRTLEQHKWICARMREGKARQQAQKASEQQATLVQRFVVAMLPLVSHTNINVRAQENTSKLFGLELSVRGMCIGQGLDKLLTLAKGGTSKLLSWAAVLRFFYDKPMSRTALATALACSRQTISRALLSGVGFSGLGRRLALLVCLAFFTTCAARHSSSRLDVG